MREGDLDSLFAEARDAAPLPSGDLVRRVEMAGLAEQSARLATSARPVPAQRGLLHRFAHWVGGVGVTAGLATATLAGVWLGAVQPAGLSNLTDSVSQALGMSAYVDRIDLIPTLDPFVSEG